MVWRPETVAAITALAPGAFLAVAQPASSQTPSQTPTPSSSPAPPPLVVVCWRGRGYHAINVMCSKEALHVMGHRLIDLGVSVTFPVDIKQNRHTIAATSGAAPVADEAAGGGGDAASCL